MVKKSSSHHRSSITQMPSSREESLQISVKSKHPNFDTPMILQQMYESLPKLKASLNTQKKIKVRRVTTARRGTLPIDPTTALITVGVMFGTEVTKELAKEVVSDAYHWLKDYFSTSADVKRIKGDVDSHGLRRAKSKRPKQQVQKRRR
jgi:hypothetical protein